MPHINRCRSADSYSYSNVRRIVNSHGLTLGDNMPFLSMESFVYSPRADGSELCDNLKKKLLSKQTFLIFRVISDIFFYPVEEPKNRCRSRKIPIFIAEYCQFGGYSSRVGGSQADLNAHPIYPIARPLLKSQVTRSKLCHWPAEGSVTRLLHANICKNNCEVSRSHTVTSSPLNALHSSSAYNINIASNTPNHLPKQ